MSLYYIIFNLFRLFTLNSNKQIKKLARKQESLGDKGLPKTSNTDSDSKYLSKCLHTLYAMLIKNILKYN